MWKDVLLKFADYLGILCMDKLFCKHVLYDRLFIYFYLQILLCVEV